MNMNELQRRTSNGLPSLFGGFSVSEWFDRFFDEFESRLPDAGLLKSTGREHPRIDLSEDSSNLYVDAALPGWSEDDIKLSIEPGLLILQGTRSEEHQVNDEKKRYIERRIAARNFTRQIKLPDVDVNDVTADLKDGILHITLPKLTPDKPAVRQIKINRKQISD